MLVTLSALSLLRVGWWAQAYLPLLHVFGTFYPLVSVVFFFDTVEQLPLSLVVLPAAAARVFGVAAEVHG